MAEHCSWRSKGCAIDESMDKETLAKSLCLQWSASQDERVTSFPTGCGFRRRQIGHSRCMNGDNEAASGGQARKYTRSEVAAEN